MHFHVTLNSRTRVGTATSALRKSLRAVVLRQLQGLTIAQTARHLGLSVTAVKARTFYARRCLRRHLERKLLAPLSFMAGISDAVLMASGF